MTETEPYDRLNLAGQVRRLRSAAIKLLAEDGFRVKSCRVIRHQHNTTFRVESYSADRLFLRVSRQVDRTPQAIRSEMEWLALLADEGFPVAEPLVWSDGEPLRPFEHPSCGEPRIVTKFAWREGKRVRRPSADQWRRIGGVLAQLHNHAEARPFLGEGRWTTDAMVGNHDDPEAAAREVVDALGAEAWTVLARVRDAYMALRPDLGKPILIHADLHQGNVLFQGDSMTVVDFDDCGRAPIPFDFSIPIDGMREVGMPEMRAPFLEGYRTIRDLPPNLEERLPTLLRHRLGQVIVWIIGERRNPGFVSWWEAWCRERLSALAAETS